MNGWMFGVIELMLNHSARTKKKELYIIPGCPHRINEWIVGEKLEMKKLHEKIIEYIKE